MKNIEKPCLFLDRDGVINRKLEGDYVKKWSEFEWLPGVVESFGELGKYFYPILVVTNQQGIGKGLMTESDLQQLHLQLTADLKGLYKQPVIHDFYYCPHLAGDHCFCRKPENGMFLQATTDYPFIQLNNAWMVGDSLTDMKAARSLGIHTASVGFSDKKADLHVESLRDFLEKYRSS